MVFEKIRKFVGLGKDPLSLRGLEQFTEAQQERILNRITTKEADILDRKAEEVIRKRTERLERGSGLGAKKKLGLKEKLKQIKDFRERNLRNQAARTKKFEDNEKAFREGRLAVKPVGPTPSDPTKTAKLNVKPIQLKAPPKTLL